MARKKKEEEEVEEIEKKRRVFLALDENHPSQFVTLSLFGHSEGAQYHPARCRVINEEFIGGHPTGRFILLATAPDYEGQYQGMRRVVEESKYNIVELGTKDMERKPDWYTKKSQTDKEKLIEARLALDEKSDLVLKGARETAKLAEVSETKDKDIVTLTESNKQMLKELAELRRQMATIKKED